MLEKIDKAIFNFNEENLGKFQSEVSLLGDDVYIDLANEASTMEAKSLWRDFLDYGISRGIAYYLCSCCPVHDFET